MLDSFLDFAIENARDDVARNLAVLLNATIIDRQGKPIIIGANNLQTESAKDAWFDAIKRKVREVQAQAVVITAPVTRAIYSPEGGKKFRELQDAGIELCINDAFKLGLCEKVDAILVSLYTPLQTLMCTQDYRRVDGKVVFGEEVRNGTNSGMTFTGRFASFFDEVPAGKPAPPANPS